MKDMEMRLERLRMDAAECAITSGLATDKQKRDLFARLAAHLTALADEVELAMKATSIKVRPTDVSSRCLPPPEPPPSGGST